MDKAKFQRYMIFIAVFGSLYLYIQAFKIITTGVTAGISQLAFIITLISGSAWFTYSFVVKDPVIRVSSTLGIIGSLLILFLLFKLRGTEPEPKIDLPDNNRPPGDIIKAYSNHREPLPWLFVENDMTEVSSAEELTTLSFNDEKMILASSDVSRKENEFKRTSGSNMVIAGVFK